MKNKGDSFYCTLTIKVNGTNIIKNQFPEIELQVNPQYENFAIKKLLTLNEIEWNESLGKYTVYFSQTDTYKMLDKNYCDIRLYTKNATDSNMPYVKSAHATTTLNLGDVLSRKVLRNG